MTLQDYARSERATVTVDWVILTAALVGLSLAVTGVVAEGLGKAVDELSRILSNIEINTEF
ncbi:hypothetical protein [Jannaschia rubra]|uniref:Flp pilus assembly protein, pilin Flp n=1 Tax=Jannaschia rubra TaxID=282197 RepID=A0A0M6XKC5_9RHOB|nr:hypothetical protein [Jannaschia rubra]CTQ31630.1 hypothetical protein JAN5088_00388 [Jannaschia rubra]SFF76017.1 hypothetical protein SAMN04488517_10131 [Jannaschia rubra]